MKQNTSHIILVKNMVCQRCISSVEQLLQHLNIGYTRVILGEITLQTAISETRQAELAQALSRQGFELIRSRTSAIIERIKQHVMEYIDGSEELRRTKLSSLLSEQLHYDYSYLSDLFSSVEGSTIEQYLIHQRIEKVKELLVYDQLSLTEIAFRLGFSSVHHLSAQFKKVTGLTPTHFKKIGAIRRKALDER